MQYKPAFKYVFHKNLVLFYLNFQICTLYELLKILSDFIIFFYSESMAEVGAQDDKIFC